MLTDAQFSQLISTIQGSPWDQLFQRIYWFSQTFLLVFAAFAAFVALRQVSATKLFELLKFVEQEEFREARRVVYFEIPAESVANEWWADKQHDDWEKAAAKVCAFFDILGLVTKRSLATRFHAGVGGFSLANGRSAS